MANIKSEGKVFDANLIIETGSTLTAGNLIWGDISGTNVVRNVRSYSGVTPESAGTPTGVGTPSLDGQNGQTGIFLGILCSTQTGVGNLSGGHQTGVAFYTQGVFEFNTTPTASAPLGVNYPVWALNADTVACLLSGLSADPTGKNTTGTNPIGVVSFLPRNTFINTNTVASRVRVRIITGKQIQVG